MELGRTLSPVMLYKTKHKGGLCDIMLPQVFLKPKLVI